MREKHYYILKGNESSVKTIMKRYNPEAAAVGLRSVEMFTDTIEFRQFKEECQINGIKLIFERFEMEYTNTELKNAKYLNLQMRTYCSSFPKEYGTIYKYDNKCTCCGSGKQQVSELFIDKTKMGKKDISLTYNFDVVVSQNLHNILLREGITGIDFGNVKHKNDKMKNEPILYQMLSTNVLPRLSEKSVFYKEKFCECCQRSGLFLQSLPYYKDESLKEAKDINYTYEYFGGGWAGTPYLIISQKVYRLLKDNKIKGVVFDIVNIV